MRAIDRIAIVICVAVILSPLSAYFSGYVVELIQSRFEISDRAAIYWMDNIPRMVMWLLVNLMVAAWIFVDAPRHRISRPVWVALALTAGIWGLVVYLLRVLIVKYETGQHFHPMCPECGYDLYGIPRAKCPECGSSAVTTERSAEGQSRE